MSTESMKETIDSLKAQLASLTNREDIQRIGDRGSGPGDIIKTDNFPAEAQLASLPKWTAEMQQALDAIPREFVGNDLWVNGIKRMAAELEKAKQVRKEFRKFVDDWCTSHGLHCTSTSGMFAAETGKGRSISRVLFTSGICPLIDALEERETSLPSPERLAELLEIEKRWLNHVEKTAERLAGRLSG